MATATECACGCELFLEIVLIICGCAAVRKALEDSNNDKNNLQAHLQTLQTELQEKTAKLDELSSERVRLTPAICKLLSGYWCLFPS